MGEVAAASEQQTLGTAQINTAVEQMNTVTQQTAANAEQSASAASELSSQAETMQAVVSGFRLTVTAAARPRVHAAHGPARSPLRRFERAPIFAGARGATNGHRAGNGAVPAASVPVEDAVGFDDEHDRDVLEEF